MRISIGSLFSIFMVCAIRDDVTGMKRIPSKSSVWKVDPNSAWHGTSRGSPSGSPHDDPMGSPSSSLGSSEEEPERNLLPWQRDYEREDEDAQRLIDALMEVCTRANQISQGIYFYSNAFYQLETITAEMRRVNACGITIGVLDAGGYLRDIFDGERRQVVSDANGKNYEITTSRQRGAIYRMDWQAAIPRYLKKLPQRAN